MTDPVKPTPDVPIDEYMRDLAIFVRDFAKESDRAAVVLGAAKLDLLLQQILQRFLMPCASRSDELLDSDSPLGTFSSRIQMCFRLGLIDQPLTRGLNLIRRIRNEFAHEVSSGSLNSGSHKDRVRELVAPFDASEKFQDFKNMSFFEHVTGVARDFRAVLAIICGRLEWQLRNTSCILDVPDRITASLVPKGWSRSSSKKQPQ